MKQWEYSAVAVIFGACADRYVLQGYTPERTFDQMLGVQFYSYQTLFYTGQVTLEDLIA